MPHRLVPRSLIAVAGVILLPASGAARPPACQPARIASDQPALPVAWREALEAVVGATSRDGQPWSCAGGELFLSLDEGERDGATLRLHDAEGRAVERHVAAPVDLLPIAEALLASPQIARAALAEPAAAARPPAPPPDGRSGPAKRPSPSRLTGAREPRIVIDGLLGARYGGSLRAVWGTATIRVGVPIDAFSAGVWARVGVPYVLDPVPADFSMSDVSIGLSGGLRLIAAPISIDAAFEPSIAVISMEGGEEREHTEGAKVDVRLGGSIRAALRWTETWRGVLALDGEIAPTELLQAHRIDPSLPAVPAYGVGASLGVEAVIR